VEGSENEEGDRPVALYKDEIYHSVSGRQRQITLSTCVSLGEGAMTSLLIRPRPIRDSFWTQVFNLIQIFDTNNSIFLHHPDFNIDKATNTMGMARQPLAQNITIQMGERR
jgi:hypothetical protein